MSVPSVVPVNTDALNEHMDNYAVRVVGHQRATFDLAVRLALGCYATTKAWSVVDGWLVLFWSHGDSDAKNANLLPVPMVATDAAPFIWNWLTRTEPAVKRPDIDGDVSKGFEIQTMNGGWSYAAFRVRPIWAEHHK